MIEKAGLGRQKKVSLALTWALTLVVWGSNPAWAGDPFRTEEPRNIGNNTEAAFEAFFKKGNYQQVKLYLDAAENSEGGEPLLYALRASLGYLERDWDTLETYASQTIQTAERIKTADPLRGNLYLAVGHLLEGAYNYNQKEDTLGAIAKLQRVLQYLDEAESQAADDPEFNLLRGYLDLILAVNLPFSNPEQAIERLQNYAAPNYLVDRGIAVAYRDLKEYDKALQYVEQAMQATPSNPELDYLKGQILRAQGKHNDNLPLLQQALSHFDLALAKAEQLPKSIIKPLERERRKTLEQINTIALNPSGNENLQLLKPIFPLNWQDQ